jgi:hypothetical protein
MIDDLTLEKVKKFPPELQDEVKHFIEFIEERKMSIIKKGARIWN